MLCYNGMLCVDTVAALSIDREKRQVNCPGTSFRCLNDECIQLTAVCNGTIDCKDGSDETQDACSKYPLKCSEHDFICKYGACISGSKKCNGVNDCADNSDEEHCKENTVNRNEVDCGNGKFLCRNGVCIDDINTCDGYDDCWEEVYEPPETRTNVSSDETVALCINRRCPKFAFQCAYGGCIDKEKKCNGVPDCNDKSDEDEELCRPLEIRNPVGSSLFPSDGTCEVISSLNLILNCTIAGVPVSCNIPAKSGTKMIIRCKNGFHKNFFNSFHIETICLENGNWNPRPHDDCTVCGRRYSLGDYVPLISYSTTTKFLEYPWHVGLYEYIPNDETKYLCGGSIIHPRAVLTAAHCVYDEGIQTLANKAYVVTAGKYNSSWNFHHPLEQRIKVVNIHITIYYLGIRNRYEQDIAVLELESDIKFHTAVSAVCIDWEDKLLLYEKESALGTVVGWGNTEDGTTSDLLRIAKLRFYDFRNCRNVAVQSFENFITSDKFCAGLGNDTIVQQGDSGGGLTYPRITSNKKEEYYLYGIVSIKDQSSNKIAAFTNVTKYLAWIEQILNSIIGNTKKIYKHSKISS